MMSLKIASVAVTAFVAVMLIGAFSFPTAAFAAPKENPKTTTEDRDFRTNPNNKPIPGDETETTVESCTNAGEQTPPGQSPEDGECKGQSTY
jgi:hypothetical protein